MLKKCPACNSSRTYDINGVYGCKRCGYENRRANPRKAISR